MLLKVRHVCSTLSIVFVFVRLHCVFFLFMILPVINAIYVIKRIFVTKILEKCRY